MFMDQERAMVLIPPSMVTKVEGSSLPSFFTRCREPLSGSVECLYEPLGGVTVPRVRACVCVCMDIIDTYSIHGVCVCVVCAIDLSLKQSLWRNAAVFQIGPYRHTHAQLVSLQPKSHSHSQ